MTAVMELRKFMKNLAEERGVKLTVLPIILKVWCPVQSPVHPSSAAPFKRCISFLPQAASLALEQYPVLNARISEDESNITYVADHNISVAIDTPRGLLVPNIKAVQVLW
jgi:2-oxoisovalerate dehydrogenase E2 component (dihydrolipoyl transacylase)